MHISIAAETLWTIGGFPITNSLIMTWFVLAILLLFSLRATRSVSLSPNRIQSIAEIVIGGLYNLFESVTGKYVKQLFPLLASIFMFVIIANWVGLLPGVGTIGYFGTESHEVAATHDEAPVGAIHEEEETDAVHKEASEDAAHEESATVAAKTASHEEGGEEAHEEGHGSFVPLLRGPTADINMTLALAIVAVAAIQYYGFKNYGRFYVSRFITFKDPISFFIGALEIISELSKVLSFSFRLFGNIFAGEVLLTVMAFLMPFIVPLPFLTLELFVGFIQALVFSMLTAVFLSVALAHGEHESHAHAGKH